MPSEQPTDPHNAVTPKPQVQTKDFAAVLKRRISDDPILAQRVLLELIDSLSDIQADRIGDDPEE